MLGITGVFQHEGVFGRPGRPEEVGTTAHGQHAVAEADRPFGDDLLAVLILQRSQREFLALRIEGYQLTQHEAEVIVAAENAVGEPLLLRVERARGHFVQRGLPDVKVRTVHQQHPLRTDPAAKGAPQPRRQFQTAGATTDDHDFVMHEIPVR